MSFPGRVLRRVFGPKYRDARPVENPETEFSAQKMEVLLWQVSGMNLVVPRASVFAEWDGTRFVIAHRAEAWNVNGDQPAPLLERTGAGEYTYAFAASYLNNEGADVVTNIIGARASCAKVLDSFDDRIEVYAWKDPDNPLRVQVRLWNAGSGAGVDAPFWLEVL